MGFRFGIPDLYHMTQSGEGTGVTNPKSGVGPIK